MIEYIEYNEEFFRKNPQPSGRPPMSLFAKRLRELREEKRESQELISQRLHLAKATYGTYETSRYLPDAETISQLASYFNVSADYLLGRSDSPIPEKSGGLFDISFSEKCIDCLLDISKSKAKTRIFEAMIGSKSFEKILAYMNTYLQFSEKLEKSDKEQYQEAYKRATRINVSANDYLSVDAYPDGGVKVADVYLSLIQESLKSILDDIAKENKEYYKKEMMKIVSEEASK